MPERARHLILFSSLLLFRLWLKPALLRATGASAMLHTFAFPIFFAHSAQKISSCSCVGVRRISANARASSAFENILLTVLIKISFLGWRGFDGLLFIAQYRWLLLRGLLQWISYRKQTKSDIFTKFYKNRWSEYDIILKAVQDGKRNNMWFRERPLKDGLNSDCA